MQKNINKCFILVVGMILYGTVTIAQQKPSERKISVELSNIKDIQNKRNAVVMSLPPATPGGPQHTNRATNKAPSTPPGGSFKKASQQPIVVPPRKRPK